jgi:EAL domain-containing protein (putative c-di-GMP-specific phosphodiesterase class I)/AmiR/NasT family two-component response regulator
MTRTGDTDLRRQPRILLLDDDQFMLGLQARMLRSMGYGMISTAGSGLSAMMMLQQNPHAIDVIFCDLDMPGMDGIEFLQKLSASSFRGNVILLSGQGVRIMHTVQKLLGQDVVILGALEKPAGRPALRMLLDRWKPPAQIREAVPAPTFVADEIHAANRQGQWVLHYQPTVDLTTGALKGMEALVRWADPRHGTVYPNDFIQVAEECGAIDALTDWVMQEAIRQLARWQEAGLQTHMAVNVSMENLRSPGFAERVSAWIRETATSPADLTLEITESRLMSPSPAPLESLVRLRMQGFGLSIDDFGTGHSSLAQLRDVPFTELKIDRGFVHGARHNQIIRPILEGSIGIARRLGMQSVAEGVETEDDWHLLRDIGCDLAQGWYIAKAMPPEDVPAWLRHWETRRTQLASL